MPSIFISYRRADSADAAGRIHDRLEAHFGREAVFMDVDAIPLGADFRQHIGDAVGRCGALLAVIGDRWLDDRHGDGPRQGQRRLDDPADFVRIEIESALARGIPVVPVLVGTGRMPPEQDLPDGLKPLAFRNAAEVRSGRDFRDHVERLIRGIEQLLPQEGPRRPGSGERSEAPAGPGIPGDAGAHIFLAFNQRFEKLLEGCPDAFSPEALSKGVSEATAAGGPALRACLVRYLNLCSEEYYLWRAGHLASEVWAIWRAEIECLLRAPLYRSAWPELRSEYNSYPEFIAYVEQVQGNNPNAPATAP